MRRKWLVSIEESIPADNPVALEGDIAKRFAETIESLADRVDGDLSFAAVPTESLVTLLGNLGFSAPIHLVVPREAEGGGSAPEGIWSDRFKRVASTNVQPGRGDTRDDWDDCTAWLNSIAEIRLIICSDSVAGDSANCRTRKVQFSINSGEACFTGFSSEGLETDPDFNQVVCDVFGKQELPDDLESVKKRASDVAKKNAPWFRFLETGSLFLNISPSIILAVAAAMVWDPTTKAVWKFTAALLATLAALGLKKVRSRRCWLNSRALSEICRSLKHSGDILDPLFPPAANHLTKHASLARSLAITMKEIENGNALSTRQIKKRYVDERLDGEKGQIHYFSGQAATAKNRRKRIKKIFQISTTLALVSTIFALLSLLGGLPGSEAFNERWVSGFATFAFPALAAAAIGYLGLSETTRRADYFEEMVSMLTKQKKIISSLKSESSIMEAIRKTESILLEEFAGWIRRRIY